MDASRFDRCIRVFAESRTRLQTVLGAIAAVVGLSAASGVVEASQCTKVGKPCGNANDCCSGVCKGGSNKTCRAHDMGGCKKGQNSCNTTDEIRCPVGSEQGSCYTTTGNAGYCATDGECARCTTDKNCQHLFGPSAACIKNCNVCPHTDGFACVGNLLKP